MLESTKPSPQYLGQRSKKGCTTCKRKKVKCNESQPLCGRCERLRLPCLWERSRTPLAQRRRGFGSWRSRHSWIPPSIAPNISLIRATKGDKPSPNSADLAPAHSEAPLVSGESSPQDLFTASLSITSDALSQHQLYSIPRSMDACNGFDLGGTSDWWPGMPSFGSTEPLRLLDMFSPLSDQCTSELVRTAPEIVPEDTGPSPDGCPANIENPNQNSMPDLGIGGTSDWWPGMLSFYSAEPLRLVDTFSPCSDQFTSDPVRTAPELTLEDTGSSSDDWHANRENPNQNFGPDQGTISKHKAISLSPNPGLLNSNIPLPSSMTLSSTDRFALYHYQLALPLSFTTKDPNWSTYRIFLRVGTQQPMVMHFLLATSLKTISVRQEVKTEDIDTTAQQHFQAGADMIIRSLGNRNTDTNHTTMMTSFWFLYIYRARQPKLDINSTKLLSEMVAEYVQKHELDVLCTQHASITAAMPPETRSLIARLLVWLFYADCSLSFRKCGGQLANYLLKNKRRLEKVYDTSRVMLERNWGQDYPHDQLVDDIENSSVLEMLYRVHMIYQAINEVPRDSAMALMREENIECQMLDLEVKYSSIFKIAQSDVSPRPRLLRNADFVVCHFYAVRLYYFRCTVRSDQGLRPAVVSEALKSLLGIAYRAFANDEPSQWSIQWPLLIAGAETSDPIHLDWVQRNMSNDVFKIALEKILKLQAKTGGRVGISQIREMCCGSTENRLNQSTTPILGYGGLI